MSKQWNQVSSASRGPSLLEVMSEELRNRINIIEEDFVWVEMAEAHPRADPSESFPLRGKTEDETSSMNSYSISNVVQPNNNNNIDCDGEISDHIDCISDLQEDDDLQEAEYVNQCIKNKVKPFDYPRLKYRQPYMLKIRERGIYSVEKRKIWNEQNDQKNCEQKNKLLPKMKFDASTTAVLEMSIINKYLGQFNELIYTGRNSVVFHAYCTKKNFITMPSENAVKIYKTSKDEGKNKILFECVQKEFEHLNIIKNLHFKIFRYVISPWPVRATKNVIVMGFVGFRETVTPSVEDVPHKNDKAVYNSLIDYMDKWYNIANLVHGKLSVKKIYWLNDRPYIIGWSHSVKRGHPLALAKLMKDCLFVTEFYKERGVRVKSATDLFKLITKQVMIDDRVLEIVQGKDLYKKYKSNPNRETSPVKSNTNKRFK